MSTLVLLLFSLSAGLFCLKIAWNLGIPYWLTLRKLRARTATQQSGVSLMPIEVLFLAFCVALTFPLGEPWPLNPAGVLVIGGATTIGSYLHLKVVAVLGGWLVRPSRRRTGDPP